MNKEALFGQPANGMFPYVEFVKRDGRPLTGNALLQGSLGLLRHHLGHRPAHNPIAAWRQDLGRHIEKLAALEDEGVAALHGWRAEVFGNDALALRKGNLAIALEGGQAVVVELEDD